MSAISERTLGLLRIYETIFHSQLYSAALAAVSSVCSSGKTWHRPLLTSLHDSWRCHGKGHDSLRCSFLCQAEESQPTSVPGWELAAVALLPGTTEQRGLQHQGESSNSTDTN